MKKLIMIKFLALLFIIGGVSAQEPAELATFNQVMKIMDKHYYDSKFSGLNWKELSEKTREEIKTASSAAGRYKLINKQLRKLNHSHLEFHPPGWAGGKKKVKIPQGSPKQCNFELEFINNKWLVTSVVKESDAWYAGLRTGHHVVSLNNWETEGLFESEKVMSYYYMKMTLNNFPKQKIELKVKDKEGNEHKFSWKLSTFKGKIARLGNLAERIQVKSEILPRNIGYVSFNIYLVEPVTKAIKAIKTFRDKGCPGIIIDVRNNPGGMAALASAIAKEFCTEDYNLGTQTGRESVLKFPVFAQPKPYKGRVVILQNKYSASTSEVMAAGIQSNKSAVIIGETSAGMALPSVIVNFKDGSVFQYPVADFKTVDGKNVEGIGVIPDIKVSHTEESLAVGKDVFIEAALKYLTQKPE